ncbi:MAG TPA: ATP-binding cassette domain-containing protein [Acidimicrobiales bacterium]|nr:ATP-binding cassette domain-containing protein [Acidimicrobiales bacterium]
MRRGAVAPLPWLGGLLALYLLVPVVAFLIRLATSHGAGFGQPGLAGALSVSVVTATVSAGLVGLLGVPLAYVLARSKSRVATVVGVLVQLPLAMPPLMGGLLLIELVGPYSAIGQALGGRLTDTMAGVVLAQTFVASPFLVVTARAAFASIDPSVTDHAATLGHRELARFWRVSLPIAAPGIRAGLVLSWLRAFGEYGATVILAYHPFTLPVLTFVQFSSTGVPATQAPTAIALAVAAAVAALGRRRLPRRRRAPLGLPVPVAPGPGSPTPVGCDLDVVVGTFHLQVAYEARTARLAVLGPSGSGKTVTLRALAGLLGPDAGAVTYGGRSVGSVPAEGRRLGYVPQGYGLPPHLTVWEQVCLGAGTEPAIAAYWLERLALGDLARRLPAELSGGQRQRVALAQALARRPDLVLLDEPFSALDTAVRHQLRTELRRLQREAGLSTVLVTHDPEEAAFLADEVIVLVGGQVLQAGPRQEVFGRPASPEVAALLGVRNLVRGLVRAPGEVESGDVRVVAATEGMAPGTEVVWGIRTERVGVGAGPYVATVTDVADLGAVAALEVRLGSAVELHARLDEPARLAPGDTCRIAIPADAVMVWPAAPAPILRAGTAPAVGRLGPAARVRGPAGPAELESAGGTSWQREGP